MSLEQIFSEFVDKVTEGRDSSHGWVHMRDVADTTFRLYQELPPRQQIIIPFHILLATAWLHDVMDAKYDPEKTLRDTLIQFLESVYLPANLILRLIECVSYSYEVMLQGANPNYRQEWEQEFGEAGLLVRDLVSDADKLHALGFTGFVRCTEYIQHMNPNLSPEEVYALVYKHAQEKLFHLHEFLRTEPGKQHGMQAHQEMVAVFPKQ